MMCRARLIPTAVAFALLFTCGGGGCIFTTASEEDLERLAEAIEGLVDEIQDADPRDVEIDNVDVVIDDDVEFVDDIEGDLEGADLDLIVLLGIENLTGVDLFVGYEVDGEFQGVFVFNGETVLLEYDCFTTVELVSEDDFEPETGVFIEGFDLFDALFEIGLDFECGDALIITFDVDEIVAVSEPLN